MVRSVVIAVVVCALGAPSAPAWAQPPALPAAPGTPGPLESPEAQPPPPNGPPGGDVVSYYGNPQHTQATEGEPVFGPLAIQWIKRFEGPPNQPLIVGGRVLVNVANGPDDGYGSRLVALDAWTGRELWRQPIPGVYFSAPLAADSERVVSINHDGLARAFAISDGRPLWSSQVATQEAVPVAADGVVYFGATAVDIATGQVLWRNNGAIQSLQPVIDSQRLYMTHGCRGATALARSDGRTLWERTTNATCADGSGVDLLHRGRLLTDDSPGWRYDAETGAGGPAFADGGPQAAAADLGFRPGPVAFSIDTGELRWRFGGLPDSNSPHNFASLRPLVVGHDVYALSGRSTLVAFDRENGAPRGAIDLPQEGYNAVGGIRTGMSASANVLVATGGLLLTGFRSLLRPTADGVDAGVTVGNVFAGERGQVAGAAGAALRGRGPSLVLESDPYPFDRFREAARSGPVNADGTAFFDTRPTRNTRYRIRTEGVPGASRAVTLYVNPKARATMPSRLNGSRYRMRVRLTGGRDLSVGGRRLVLYLGRYVRGSGAFKLRYHRVGAAQLRRSSRRTATATVIFRLPSPFVTTDVLAWCMPGVRAWGRNEGLNRRCGARAFKPRGGTVGTRR